MILFQVRQLDADCLKAKKEISNLKDQLAKEEHMLEESRRETFSTKQKLAEIDGAREVARREGQQLARKLNDHEEDYRVREKDFQMAVDEAMKGEGKAQEKVKNLENLLENANQVNPFLSLPRGGGGLFIFEGFRWWHI